MAIIMNFDTNEERSRFLTEKNWSPALDGAYYISEDGECFASLVGPTTLHFYGAYDNDTTGIRYGIAACWISAAITVSIALLIAIALGAL